jgi:hypothetical protein
LQGETPTSTLLWSSDSPKADCLYGESGTGKTTQIGRLARFVYKKTGKLTRLVCADPGGWKAIDPYVRLGIIKPISLLDEHIITPLECLKKLTEGYWPFDPVTGEPLLRQVPKDYVDPAWRGRMVYDFTNIKAQPTAETWKIFGGMAIEGLHSISTFVQNYLSANPKILGELAGGAGTKGKGDAQMLSQIKEGSEVYVQPGKASYGYVQKKVYDLVRQSCDLPLEKILWTSLEKLYELKDQDGNIIASEHYYPSMIGTAGLRASPQWFGALIHMENVQTGVKAEDRPDKPKIGKMSNALVGTTETEVRAYIRDHIKVKDGNLCKAKSRVPIEVISKMPAVFRVTLDKPVFRPGEPEVWDLCSLYELEDSVTNEATAAVAADLGVKL